MDSQRISFRTVDLNLPSCHLVLYTSTRWQPTLDDPQLLPINWDKSFGCQQDISGCACPVESSVPDTLAPLPSWSRSILSLTNSNYHLTTEFIPPSMCHSSSLTILPFLSPQIPIRLRNPPFCWSWMKERPSRSRISWTPDAVVVLRPRTGYVSKVPTTPFRDQVVSLQALPPKEADPALALLCPVHALHLYIDRTQSLSTCGALVRIPIHRSVRCTWNITDRMECISYIGNPHSLKEGTVAKPVATAAGPCWCCRLTCSTPQRKPEDATYLLLIIYPRCEVSSCCIWLHASVLWLVLCLKQIGLSSEIPIRQSVRRTSLFSPSGNKGYLCSWFFFKSHLNG